MPNGLLRHSASIYKGLAGVPPSIPTLGTLIVVSDTEFSIAYDSAYPVEFWYSETELGTYTKHGDSVATPYAMTGLTQGTLYYIKPRAKNGSKYSAFGSVGSATTQLPFESDLNSLIIGRDVFSMIDTVGVSDATILTPTALNVTSATYLTVGDKTRAAEKFFNSGEYTFYAKIKILVDTLTGSNYYIFKLGKVNAFSAADKGLAIILSDVTNSDLYVHSADGTTRFDGKVLTNAQNLMRSAGWCEILTKVSFANKNITVSVYGEDGNQIGSTGTKDITTFAFFDTDNTNAWTWNNQNITAFDLKKFTGLKTITQCRDRSYVTDLQIYIPDLISGIDVSGNGNHLTPDTRFTIADRYYDSKQSYLLDKGYVRYTGNTTTRKDVWIPNDLSGNEITITAPDGRTKEKLYAGQSAYHNGADSLIVFANDELDRSSATIYNDYARAVNLYQNGYYDATNPKRWHPIELNRLKNQYMANVDYDGKWFVKFNGDSLIDRNYLEEILIYTTNKSISEQDIIHSYCNDELLNRTNSINMTTTIADVTAADSGYYTAEAGANIYQVLTGGVIKKMTAGAYTGYSNVITVSDGTHDVRIIGELSKLLHWHTWDKNINVDITEFAKASQLEYLGLISPAPRKGFGSFSNWDKIKELWLGCPSIDEDATFGYDGDVDTTPLLEVFESQWDYIDLVMKYPVRRVTGSFENTNMRQFCAETDIGGVLPNVMEYLSWVRSGTKTLTGDVSNWVDCWWLSIGEGAESVTGNTIGLVKMECLWPSISMTKPANLQHMPMLSSFQPLWSLTAAEVNQYLADIWANRTVPRVVTINTVAGGNNNALYRTITLTAGTTEAPTGQGLIDKAALQSYVSPTPPGDGVPFTVVTK